MKRKFGATLGQIEMFSTVRLYKHFEYLSLKFLYDVVKATKRTHPGRLNNETQLTGLARYVL